MEILSALFSVSDISTKYMPDILKPYSQDLDLDRLPSIISELSALFKDFSSKMDCKTLLLKIIKWMIPPLIKFFQFAKQWVYTMVEKAINYFIDEFLSRAVNYILPEETAKTVTQFLRWILQSGARILVDVGFSYVTSWVTGLLLPLVQVTPKKEESNIPDDTSQNTEVQVTPKKEESNIPDDTSQNTEVKVKEK